MSQREVLIMLAHALSCPACRTRLLTESQSVFSGRALAPEEKESLSKLQEGDFITAQLLARSTGYSVDQLREYADHPVARLRHF